MKKADKVAQLTPMQYEVTQENGTETPFNNEYWDNRYEGIYVDLVSGEALFCSLHKYDSGTGWPSFYKALIPENIVVREDNKLSHVRMEVRSKDADSHLGHLFNDGPPPSGLRYCINSAALRFIPKEKLVSEGYGQFLSLFSEKSEKKDDKASNKDFAVAYLAGGCFWCVEADFLKVDGILSIESGYMGGNLPSPTYEQVSSGQTGHAEAVKIEFDPRKISYANLLKIFWLNIDPTKENEQFGDVGEQYRTAIFFVNEEQEKTAKESLLWLKKEYPELSVHTEITAAKTFYRAELSHQRYAKKNPLRYRLYRFSCGRDKRLNDLFGEKRESLLAEIKNEVF